MVVEYDDRHFGSGRDHQKKLALVFAIKYINLILNKTPRLIISANMRQLFWNLINFFMHNPVLVELVNVEPYNYVLGWELLDTVTLNILTKYRVFIMMREMFDCISWVNQIVAVFNVTSMVSLLNYYLKLNTTITSWYKSLSFPFLILACARSNCLICVPSSQRKGRIKNTIIKKTLFLGNEIKLTFQ